MAKKQELFAFARITPAEYQDDLEQLRISFELEELLELDKLEAHRKEVNR